MKTWVYKAAWHCRKWTNGFWKRDEGLGTLEIVLIAAVLIIIAVIFKDWIVRVIENLLGTAEEKTQEIFE